MADVSVDHDWARPVVHWEIQAKDPELVRRFYAGMFNWSIADGPVMFIEAGIGGPEPGPAGHIRQGQTSRISLYVQVRDINESLARCEQLGGTVTATPFDLPGGPTLATLDDPEGNPVVLVQQ